ncbi:MAG TPA: acetolactate synthase small subunit [Candidatus Ornithoclostridium excrementipullorum]|nr:acetolactate synthase small subunit [Candidatus Ornithoclostridium excrementipullorum]
MKHIVSVVVYNNPSVLARVCGLFGRRGFNIDSLSVATTDDPKISRITITAQGDENTLDQIVKQTSKLEETINVTALKEEESVCRELLLVKVVTDGAFDNSIVQLADEYGALILDITSKSMILELTGTSRKIDNFVAALTALRDKDRDLRVKNVCRTGITALDRGV